VHRLLEKQEIICWESDEVSDSYARRRLETEHRGQKQTGSYCKILGKYIT